MNKEKKITACILILFIVNQGINIHIIDSIINCITTILLLYLIFNKSNLK